MFEARGGTAPSPSAGSSKISSRRSRYQHSSARPHTQAAQQDLGYVGGASINGGHSSSSSMGMGFAPSPLTAARQTSVGTIEGDSPRHNAEMLGGEDSPWPSVAYHMDGSTGNAVEGYASHPLSFQGMTVTLDSMRSRSSRPQGSPGRSRLIPSPGSNHRHSSATDLAIGASVSNLGKKQTRRGATSESPTVSFGRISPSEILEELLHTDQSLNATRGEGTSSQPPPTRSKGSRQDKMNYKVATPLTQNPSRKGRSKSSSKTSMQFGNDASLQDSTSRGGFGTRPGYSKKNRNELSSKDSFQDSRRDAVADDADMQAFGNAPLPKSNSLGRVESARTTRPGTSMKKNKQRNKSANAAMRRQREEKQQLAKEIEHEQEGGQSEECQNFRRHSAISVADPADPLNKTVPHYPMNVASPNGAKTSQWVLDDRGSISAGGNRTSPLGGRPPSRQRNAFPTHLSELDFPKRAFTQQASAKQSGGEKKDASKSTRPMHIHAHAESTRKVAEKHPRPPSRHKPPDRSLFLEVPDNERQPDDFLEDSKERLSSSSPLRNPHPLRGVQADRGERLGGRDFRDNPDLDGFSQIQPHGPPTFRIEITNSAMESNEFRPGTEDGHKVPREVNAIYGSPRQTYTSPEPRRPMSRNSSRSATHWLESKMTAESDDSQRWQPGWHESSAFRPRTQQENPLVADGFSQPQQSWEAEEESWTEVSIAVEDTESNLFDTTLEQEFLSLFAPSPTHLR